MPALNFKIQVFMENPDMLPELQARVADLRPAFEAIYGAFVDINAQKFQQSVGMEQSGADVFDEEWAAITPAYYREKHGEGSAKVTKKAAKGGSASFGGPYPDWLLVRTGALRAAMLNPDALFHEFDKQMAQFGMPMDSGLADIVMWQMGDRQKNRFIIFLSQPDQNAIKQTLQDYFQNGPQFASLRMSQGLAAVGYAPVDALGMEADFEEPGL